MNRISKIISFLLVFVFGVFLIVASLYPGILEESEFYVLFIEGAIAIIISILILFNTGEDKVEKIDYSKRKGRKK
jgi:hypothetical protein